MRYWNAGGLCGMFAHRPQRTPLSPALRWTRIINASRKPTKTGKNLLLPANHLISSHVNIVLPLSFMPKKSISALGQRDRNARWPRMVQATRSIRTLALSERACGLKTWLLQNVAQISCLYNGGKTAVVGLILQYRVSSSPKIPSPQLSTQTDTNHSYSVSQKVSPLTFCYNNRKSALI